MLLARCGASRLSGVDKMLSEVLPVLSSLFTSSQLHPLERLILDSSITHLPLHTLMPALLLRSHATRMAVVPSVASSEVSS
jgi:hypothetical protein